jgi:hypothetical protein
LGVMNVENMVQDHEKRIIALEEFQLQTNENIEKLQKSQEQTQNGMLRLENVVMSSTKETREILQPFAQHVLDQAEFSVKSANDMQIKKLDARQKIIIGVATTLFGGGGLAGIIAGIAVLIQK